MTSEIIERLERHTKERAEIVNQIARILWTHGGQSAQWEGDGAPPDWDDLTDARTHAPGDDAGEEERQIRDSYTCYWMQTWHSAEALLDIDANDTTTLVKLLIDNAARQQEQFALDMWRKVERAAGFEPGSLSGKPGVRQRVFV